MKCILLCAGYSMDENLKLKETASSLTLINGKPLINYTIDALEKVEIIDEIFVVTNGFYYSKFVDWFNDNQFGKRVKVINDNTSSPDAKLGAIGDIRYTINCENINDDLLVLAGDIYFDFSLYNFVNYYLDKKMPVVAGLYTDDIDRLKKSGVIKLKDEVIEYMQEKPEEPFGNIISVAAYIYPQNVLRAIDDYLSEGNKTTYPGYFIEYLYKITNVKVCIVSGDFYSVNSSEMVKLICEKVTK